MEIRNCSRCGRVFSGLGKTVCSVCEKDEEDSFKKVKSYIDDNPSCVLSEVSEATEVSMKKIMRYIREGRIIISQGMRGEALITCEQCGKPIVSGRYCDSCIIRISQKVDEVFDRRPQAEHKYEGAKMHFRSGKKI